MNQHFPTRTLICNTPLIDPLSLFEFVAGTHESSVFYVETEKSNLACYRIDWIQVAII